MDILLIRHGSKDSSPINYCHEKKCPDPELDELGFKQAELLGIRLKNYGI
ncbi:MAG: histidine phosphatase family protein [Lutispora sp.]|nr:histidine phosphatase family protein [Lutispora sp.]MDD4834790.1 histidine phosphatase family protein [Lutispora sp.]